MNNLLNEQIWDIYIESILGSKYNIKELNINDVVDDMVRIERGHFSIGYSQPKED